MVESSCCTNSTKQTKVVSVERVENESLWKMYQLRRDILKKSYAAQRVHFRSLTTREICFNDTTYKYTKEIQETEIRIRYKTKEY